ncbi:hypothetical protein EV715DRAFT_297491 [Schizophyllum commune]
MSYSTEAQSFYLTEVSSHYLRSLHLADLPWALTCPLESPLALEIRSQIVRQCVSAADATSGNSPQAATAMAAETASDDITATAAFADSVFEAAAPVSDSATPAFASAPTVFELAVPVFDSAAPVFKSTDNVFEAAAPVFELAEAVFGSTAPVFEPAANDDANRSESTTSSRDFLTGLAHGLDMQVASNFLTELANELDVQVEKINALSTAQN